MIVRDRLFAGVTVPHLVHPALIITILFTLPNLPVVVESFAPISTRTKQAHRGFCHHNPHHQRRKTFERWLLAHDHKVEIRDWRPDLSDAQKIYDLLLQQRQQEEQQTETTVNYFDPEGSLELDVLNRYALEESYSRDDGGCFLVAVVGGENGGNDEDKNENIEIVGTLGMISGTQVSYQSSGSSVSTAETTAAIRRVCASWPDEDDDAVNNTSSAATKTSTATILRALLLKGEQRAFESGATRLIGLAYPEGEEVAGGSNDNSGNSKRIAKPNQILLESLGYLPSEQQIKGVATTQYQKTLSREVLTTETTIDNILSDATMAETIPEGNWIVPAIVATVLALGFLIFNLYINVFGIEQLWGSSDNGGLGTSLSTQNLQELIRNEELGRTGLDDGIGSPISRQWEDLSPEELREEQALMKVIQGQDIRSK